MKEVADVGEAGRPVHAAVAAMTLISPSRQISGRMAARRRPPRSAAVAAPGRRFGFGLITDRPRVRTRRLITIARGTAYLIFGVGFGMVQPADHEHRRAPACAAGAGRARIAGGSVDLRARLRSDGSASRSSARSPAGGWPSVGRGLRLLAFEASHAGLVRVINGGGRRGARARGANTAKERKRARAHSRRRSLRRWRESRGSESRSSAAQQR